MDNNKGEESFSNNEQSSDIIVSKINEENL